ncbi:MAG: biotin--[acetyl-CoA-carboxylase] ligase [Clostridia bacterium]|nr:biotin--[acetyl-CoA-carboxylase] ligase [Clostridia bacterium]
MANGTHGRKWYTDENNNIAFSLFLQANCQISQLENLTLMIAETIVEVFENLYDISLTIKFPNDLVYQGKKLGGILTQTKLQGELVKYIVIGIGMNTNQENFEEEIRKIATSIKKEFKIEINNQKVITKFCNLFEPKIKNYCNLF